MRGLTFAITSALLLLCSFNGIAQRATVKGVVTDESNEPVPGAYILVKGTQDNTSSDDEGKFILNVPANRTINLVFTFLGKKEERELRLAEGEVKELSVRLRRVFDIGTVDIVDERERQKPMRTLDPKVASIIPSIRGGIEDLLIQAPVNFSSELSSSYSVRGGSFDENLVYVNDIQVYRPFLVRAGQQEGLSFPNPDMVESIEFSAGGFEAKYGDKMSSVLDIKYKRPSDFGGSITMSMLGGSLQIEGADSSGKFTHNSGVRFRNNSYVLGTLDTQGDYNPSYTDFQTFLTYKVKGNLELNFLGNYSRNKYNFIPQTRQTNVGNINEALRLTIYFEGQELTQFETGFGAFAVNYQPTELSMLKFIVSGFQTYEQETFDILGEYFLDELERDLGSDEFGDVVANRGVGGFLQHARNDLEATVTNFTHKGYIDLDASDHYLQWGLRIQNEQISDRLSEWTLVDSAGYSTPRPTDSIGYTNPTLQPVQVLELNDVIKGQNSINSNRFSAFIQDSYEWKNKKDEIFTATVGVRSQYWDFNGQTIVSPRANFSYTPEWQKKKFDKRTQKDTTVNRDLVITLSGGYYFQPAFYREMRDIRGVINQDIRAQRAIHAVLGADYIFEAWGRPFKLVAEAYYKDLSSLIPYEIENVRLRYYATNNSVGYATGLDLMLNGEFIDGVQSWLRASVLKTEEDLQDDFYWEYYNQDGDLIVPGFTFDQVAVDSAKFEPGYIPRQTDQRFSFSMFFQDEMRRWPQYKVQLQLFYATGLPFGPPDFERYKDILRTPSYRRVDIGFSRELIGEHNRGNRKISTFFNSAFVSLEVFNILGINNTINHTWIEDVNGRLYAIPNYLTGRRLNVKLSAKF